MDTSEPTTMDGPVAKSTERETSVPAPRVRDDSTPFGPAFRAFYERNFRFTWRIVARMADRHADVDDLTQEVFTIAGHKLDEFEGRAKETTWLYRIAQNVVVADRRKRKRQRLLSLKWLRPDPEDELDEGPDRAVEQADARVLVHSLLEEMSEKKRVVFILFELESMSGQEISELLEIPVDTVWTRLFHARREFKKLLSERGYDSFADLSKVPDEAGEER